MSKGPCHRDDASRADDADACIREVARSIGGSERGLTRGAGMFVRQPADLLHPGVCDEAERGAEENQCERGEIHQTGVTRDGRHGPEYALRHGLCLWVARDPS